MAIDQSGADEPRFSAGKGFWGQPLVPAADAEKDEHEANDGATESPAAQAAKPMGDDGGDDLDSTGQLPRISDFDNASDESFENEPDAANEPDDANHGHGVWGVSPNDPNAAFTDLSWTDEDEEESTSRFVDPAVDVVGTFPADDADSAVGDSSDDPSVAEGVSSGDESLDDSLYIDASLNIYEAQDDELPGLTTRGRRIRLAAVAVAVIAALLTVYGLGVRRFQTHFEPNTTIKGRDVAGLTLDEAQASLEDETAGFACEVAVGEFKMGLLGEDLSLERDEQRIAQEAMDQQSAYAWPLRLFSAADLAVEQGATYDDEALLSAVTEAVESYNEAELPTSGASIDYDEDAGAYVLSGSVAGTALDRDAVLAAAKTSLAAFDTTCAPAEDEALRAATLDDLPRFSHAVEWANRSRTSDVPILVNGETVATAEAWQNAQWVSIADGPTVAVDTDAIAEWAAYSVAEAVYHRDDWNDYYLDQDKFVAGLAERLATGVVDGYEAPTYDELRREGESRELAYERGGWDPDLGRYIDVDLEAQFARLFDEKGEVIWESAFVSGNMYEAHSTVTGVFNIYSMDRGVTLVGLDYDNDGNPDYESYVDYWMPFYGGYGLHDATWRYNFGGDLYYYDGSHGCINLPYKKAEELYGMTFVGEAVNVHW